MSTGQMNFVVFDADGVDAAQFPPRHALLVGPEDVPVEGDVVLNDGALQCRKRVQQSSGVMIQFQVAQPGENPSGNGLGLLTIQTCLLPERDRPYLLSIELARHQIMFFLNKLEDWGLFDLPPDHEVMQEFESARSAFTEALVAQRKADESGEPDRAGFCPNADRQAARSLAIALSAGEHLTLLQADRQIRARLAGRAYTDAVANLKRLTPEIPPTGTPILIPGAGQVVLHGLPQMGCAVSPGQFGENLQRAVLNSCDFITMPMRWSDMEPSEGKYNFTPTDRWIEWAIRTAKLPVHAGPLVDFRAQSTPEWLYIWENDYETLRDLVFEHIQAVVTRYRRTIQRWTVASGLHVNTNFKISFEQIMDLTRMCVHLVRKLHPASKIQLEVAQPWGEYHASNRRSIPPQLYAEAVLQTGLQVDSVGVRLQMGDAQPGFATRDMMSLSAMLDRFATLEKPIFVSAIGAPSAPIPPRPFRPRVGADAEDAFEPGYWRAPWSENQQAEWLTQAVSIACSKPYVQGVCWQELADAPSGVPPEMPHGGLLAAGGAPKAAFTRFAQIRQCLREGRTPLALLQQKNG